MSVTATVTEVQRITGENVSSLFPDVDTRLVLDLNELQSRQSARAGGELDGYDDEQVKLMDERCIVVDDNDQPIGSGSKKTCHLMTNIDRGLLHRAFSVFLFDSQKRLLIQQRATEKITFPDCWTNTCCSHPLGIPGETGVGLDASVQGVRRAAQRKLDHELGIKAEQVPLDKFDFLTRICYKAPSDGKWGEHEIDYILFIQADVDLDVNPNEARDTMYVTLAELKELLKRPDLKFTPWFKLICNSMLFKWWENFGTDSFKKHLNDTELHRMV
ncbi:isopentenyl-diphosphate delta-isomerase idi1 [Ophidiomyces ophidiicola]|nr:isopentenyl-diphosphate delta-isomerase idi1 [Ophidiomyces ophidiicola]KAI1988677.1 isopentenyl-diphosphate delta-isomerase idi1 [Ophidiomyces ophidiicola]KAI1989390.1 isopentenyl-diphosphate delta-isomerase idi1 [Ophidiomyces ophidiicola]KAI1990992.1 isopentenyl-diphosphate delta-isomerase idi1 [Ophidiomyces ophidiicola]